ncbi:MAG: hypothetical protein AAGH76_00160 [Pseudomonadota bacterium]
MTRSMMMLGLVLLVMPAVALAEPSPALLKIWEQEWQSRTDRIVDELVGGFEEPLAHSLDAESLAVALAELRGMFSSAVTWEKSSGVVINSVSMKCDAELLEQVEPYITGRTDVSTMDKELASGYGFCFEDAMMFAESAAMYAMARKMKASPDVMNKYERVLANSRYRRIAAAVTTAAVEEKYGALLDEAIALHSITDSAARARSVASLESRFATDPTILYVSLQDPSQDGPRYGSLLNYHQNGIRPTGKSCHGAPPPDQKGLVRCSWDGYPSLDDNVIRYERPFEFGGERLVIEIEFSYPELRTALSK